MTTINMFLALDIYLYAVNEPNINQHLILTNPYSEHIVLHH